MPTKTGYRPIGEESAAARKYRMTLSPDKKKEVPQPSIDNWQAMPFVVPVPDPPPEPRPPMARPTAPEKSKDWDDHGFFWRVRHHMGLYNHERADRKEKRAAEAKSNYARKLDRWREDEARYQTEKRAQKEELAQRREMVVQAPEPPPKPALDELDSYEKALAGLRQQLQTLAKRRNQQLDFVSETQAACQESYNRAMELLLLPGSEMLAALKAKDYLSATKELERAKNKYFVLMDQESVIVQTLDKATDAEEKRQIDENLGVVSEKLAENMEDIKNLQVELSQRALPDTIYQESAEANQALVDLLAQMQDRIKNETNVQLSQGVSLRQHVAPQGVAPLPA